VYDPAIGRFLSVDPVVRDVGAAQSWNGYGYVEGRVTSWTDPTGFWGESCNPNGHLANDHIEVCARRLIDLSGLIGFLDEAEAAAIFGAAGTVTVNEDGIEVITVEGSHQDPLATAIDTLMSPWGGSSGFTYGLGCILTCDWPGYGWDDSLAAIPFIPVAKVGRAARGATEMHHLLPQAKRFEPFFKRAGLDIEDFKIPLDKAIHRLNPGGVHTNSGGHWNKIWDDFFKGNPNATKQEILDQLARMRLDFGI
jgi:hypothetical protein